MDIERILMPTDYSACANAALDRAVFLAREHGAELHLLHVVELHAMDVAGIGPAFPDLESLHERLEGLAGSEMGRLLARHRDRSLTVRDTVRRGVAAAPTIAEVAGEERADLVVIGTHGRRGLRRLLLGSVAEEVVQTAPCPVLTVPPGSGEVGPFTRIVVPYDFSPDADQGLAVARTLRQRYGGSLDVVHVIAPPIDPETAVPLYGGSPAYASADVRTQVAEHLEKRVAGPATHSHVLEGHPASAIVDHAEQVAADLIVIASHGLTGLRRFLLGSVTAGVVRAAHCPVLTLRAPAADRQSA